MAPVAPHVAAAPPVARAVPAVASSTILLAAASAPPVTPMAAIGRPFSCTLFGIMIYVSRTAMVDTKVATLDAQNQRFPILLKNGLRWASFGGSFRARFCWR